MARYGASVVGALIVGLDSSLPELVSSVYAALADITEIVVGNVLGSNITNIVLVPGIAGLVGEKAHLNRELFLIDLPVVLGSALLRFFYGYVVGHLYHLA